MKKKIYLSLFGLMLAGSLAGCSFDSLPVQNEPDAVFTKEHFATLTGDNEENGQEISSSDNQIVDTSDSIDEPDNQTVSDIVSNDISQNVSDSAVEPLEVNASEIQNIGDAEGTFSTIDVNGNEITQEIFTKSNLTIVNVWGTFCGYCIDEMPCLGKIASEYDSAELQILGIICDVWSNGDVSSAVDIINETGAAYTHLLDNQSIEDWKLHEVYAIPQTYIIDSTGKTLYSVEGMLTEEEWRELINTYLQ